MFPWTESQLAQLNELQTFLEDPQPHTKLGQQVRRLQQHGLPKAAKAAKACGRVGDRWTYGCGRSAVRKIIRAHLRFCCSWCDRYVATKLFDEHRAYRERLHPAGVLHRVTVQTKDSPISGEGIRDFEDALVEAVREWLKGYPGWGFKSLTHYENGFLVAKGIIYLPPGASLPSSVLAIPFGIRTVGCSVSVHAYEAMLADILRPTVTDGHGVLRADLMAAFHGGNHFRSLGIFYGLISKKRLERADQEKLHLSISNTESGAGSDASQKRATPPIPTCPFCGPTCHRVRVSHEPLSELQDIPCFPDAAFEAVWDTMRDLIRRRCVF